MADAAFTVAMGVSLLIGMMLGRPGLGLGWGVRVMIRVWVWVRVGGEGQD